MLTCSMAYRASRYKKQLSLLLDNEIISEDLYRHFIDRGLNVISPSNDFGLDYLGEILPEIIIGASFDYINKMKVPYQATSYVAARIDQSGRSLHLQD